MIFHELLQVWAAFTGPDHRTFSTALKGRSAPRARRLAAVLCAVAGAAALAGCDTINPNLGAAPTQAASITQINPSGVVAGAQGLTLTVTGSGFVTGSVVTWNGLALATTYVSTTEFTALVTTADLAAAGTATVGVTAPPTNGVLAGNLYSNLVPFIISPAPNPGPTITQLSPSSAVVGSAAFTLTVTGAGFISTSQVNWNSTPRNTAFVSTTQLTAQINAADIASQGTAGVTVFTSGSGGGTSATKLFTITSAAQAAVASAGAKTVTSAGANDTASISAGARYVAFAAADSDDSGVDEIFLRDTCSGAPTGCTPQTIPVSVALIGPDPDGSSRSPSISSDGRFVVFVSDATNLVAGDSNALADVFLRDTCMGAAAGCTPTTTLLSIAADGGAANGASASPSISADGRFVSFDSNATNLAPDNAQPAAGAYLRDTCFGVSGSCTPSTTPLAISPVAAR